MLIFWGLKEIFSYLASIVYVGAITWLLPIIIILAILSACGICATKLFAAGAKTIGTLFTMAATGIIKGIPNLVKNITRFWRWMRNGFAKIMPVWAATILAWVVLIII